MAENSENIKESKDFSLEETFSIKNLEFDKIIQRLERSAYSPLGKRWVTSLVPMRIPWRISFHQKETSEARDFLNREEKLPSFSNLQDIRQDVKLASIGSSLTIKKLWSILLALRSIRQIRESITKSIGEYSIIREYAGKLLVFNYLEEILVRCIEDEETISDNATPDLRKYRHNLREQNYRIQEKSKHLARKYSDRNMLTDSTFTVRNNRYVLPFSSGSMGREKVIIQSSSESGLTFYGEPLELVELNNELQKATQLVRTEEERIIQMLSAKVAEIASQLIPCVDICGYLDFIFAKGYLSRDLKATEPVFNHFRISLEKVRHPLLKKDSVVPIDICFGENRTGMILTGPNAGGKTVSLKTLGLIALMAQAGLHIPAQEKSSIPVFRSILAEIGDAQSIDLDLSSFGAHIQFLKKVIASVDNEDESDEDQADEWIEKYQDWKSRGDEVAHESENSESTEFSPYDILKSEDLYKNLSPGFYYEENPSPLILLDEIGRSTDPEEGSALALALIDRLIESNTFFALTTHLPALKNLVLEQNSKITGASMGFDLDKMETTYKIELDTIGASYGIVIAEKMGLSGQILENAKARLEGRYKLLEIDIPRLQKKREELGEYVEKWERKKHQAEREELRELTRLIILKKIGMEYYLSLIDKSDDLLRETSKKCDRLIELARKGKKVRHEMDEKRAEISVLKDKLEEAYNALSRMGIVEETRGENLMINVFEPGKRVWISILNREGVVEHVKKDGKRIIVVIDGKKMEINASQATLIEKPPTEQKKSKIEVNLGQRKLTPLWLDLHGERVEAALEKVEDFLHSAFLENRTEVNIVHGIGTGQLRRAIRNYLKKHPLVKSFRDADLHEGALGATIVEFKRKDDDKDSRD